MLNNEDQLILEELSYIRNLAPNTIKNYKQSIKNYTESQEMSLTELLEEAETEEEQGIRLKNRTLKKRIITFQNHLLQKGLSKGTLEKQVQQIKTIYKHYEIEIPNIPKFNNTYVKDYEPIYYDDLPTKELIQEALLISKPLMRAIILFITSSGCAREETLSLTMQDFIDATNEYHNSTDIYDVINELKQVDNVIPIFKLKRRKTNQYYYTFCSPEAVDSIISYLESREDYFTNDMKLFKIDKIYFIKQFTKLNEQLGCHRKGAYGIMRSHMLRKFHASNLARGKNGLTIEEIDSLQGRGKNLIHKSYFLDDPQELKRKYVANMDKVLINYTSKTLTFEDEEIAELKKKADKIEELEMLVKKIMERNQQ